MTDTAGEEYGYGGPGGWEDVPVAPVQADAWAQAGYRPNEATRWLAAGVLDPGYAAEWERVGFTPSTAQPWLALGEVGPLDALTMSDAGLTPADCARIRAGDRRCVAVVTDDSGRPRITEEPPAIGF